MLRSRRCGGSFWKSSPRSCMVARLCHHPYARYDYKFGPGSSSGVGACSTRAPGSELENFFRTITKMIPVPQNLKFVGLSVIWKPEKVTGRRRGGSFWRFTPRLTAGNDRRGYDRKFLLLPDSSAGRFSNMNVCMAIFFKKKREDGQNLGAF